MNVQDSPPHSPEPYRSPSEVASDGSEHVPKKSRIVKLSVLTLILLGAGAMGYRALKATDQEIGIYRVPVDIPLDDPRHSLRYPVDIGPRYPVVPIPSAQKQP